MILQNPLFGKALRPRRKNEVFGHNVYHGVSHYHQILSETDESQGSNRQDQVHRKIPKLLKDVRVAQFNGPHPSDWKETEANREDHYQNDSQPKCWHGPCGEAKGGRDYVESLPSLPTGDRPHREA